MQTQIDYEMYTDEGNDAVRRALESIEFISQVRTKVWNRETLNQAARPIIDALAEVHGEVYDTEPRGHISDFMDMICKCNGWTYDDGWGDF